MPAVIYAYTNDRKGERPAAHLREFCGVLQVDGYAGFELAAGNRVVLAACCGPMRGEALYHAAGLGRVGIGVAVLTPGSPRLTLVQPSTPLPSMILLRRSPIGGVLHELEHGSDESSGAAYTYRTLSEASSWRSAETYATVLTV